MNSKTAFVALSLMLASVLRAQFIDLEKELKSDFVLSTKKIEIPGFPDAFNPSIVRWHNGLLMSFRTGAAGTSGESGDEWEPDSFLMSFRFRDRENVACANDSESQKTDLICKNQIALVFLNHNFEPISWPQILDIRYEDPMVAERQQDPRLVQVGTRLFMVYSNMLYGRQVPEIRRIFVVELFYDGQNFRAGRPVSIENYEGVDEQKWTKNWVPFDFGEQLQLAHSISPHRVFHYDGSSEAVTTSETHTKLTWDYGVLRGGTPALFDNGHYLAFFHSSKEMKTAHSAGKKIQHYFMGAYLFDSAPPFRLKAISRVPIVGEQFYWGQDYQTWKPLRVVFPGGILISDDKVWVAYGRQDHEVWVATLDKKGLMESMATLH